MPKHQKLILPCDLCKGRGKLWLRGNDYVECPNCYGEGKIPVVQEQVQARVQDRYTPQQGGGLKKDVHIILPGGN